MTEVVEERIKQVKCGVCKEVGKKVCIQLPDETKALLCIDSLEEITKKDGEWGEAVKTFKDLGVLDEVAGIYAEKTGKSKEFVLGFFNHAAELEHERDKEKTKI